MAEGKKGVLVYADWGEIFEELEDAEAGRLIKHFFRYINDTNPEAPDKLTNALFIPIKQTLKRDLIKWEDRAGRSRENGKSGGRPKKKPFEETQDDNLGFEETQITQQVFEEPRKPDTVSVSDTVIVKEKKEKDLLPSGNFQKINDAYFSWYEHRVGVKPPFNAQEGKALKSIVAYLEKTVKEKGLEPDVGTIEAWRVILERWDQLKPFERDQLKLSQINSNMANILNQIRNGTTKGTENRFANSEW